MKPVKNGASIPVILGLMFSAAWCASRLSAAFMWSRPVVTCIVLSLEAVVFWISSRLNRGKMTVKTVLGVICLTCLGLALAIGLYSAVGYLIASLMGDGMGTSFPWYTVLFFAMLAVGPVILVTGIAWIVMHLRERKRNIKDIRLLTQLLLIGTMVWAVFWTAFRIRHILVYPNSFNHPWPASIAMAIVYYGPWLLIEGGIWYLLRHFEKKLTPEDLAEVSSEKPVAEGKPIRWEFVAKNAGMLLVPLVLMGLLMFCLWDTEYLTWNISMAVCATVNVCVMIGLSAWYLCYNRKQYTLCQMKILVLILIGLTVVGSVGWSLWYNANILSDSTHHGSNLLYILALGFFGPILLGEVLMLGLLDRLPAMEVGEKKRFPILVLALLMLLLVSQVTDMDYRNEIPMTVTRVTNHNGTGTSLPNVVVALQADYDIHSIYDHVEETREDGIYLRFNASWRPFNDIGERTVGYTLYPENEIQKIYLYEPGYGYQLILVRDAVDGHWVLND